MTFRIELFCDDRKLADILRALADAGAYEVKSTPVPLSMGGPEMIDVSALKLNGVSPKVQMVFNKILESKATELRAPQLKVYMKEAGLNPISIGYVSSTMAKAGMITVISRGYYKVTGE